MSSRWNRKLRKDRRVHNRDIHKIIARAEELQQEYQSRPDVSVSEMRELSRDLDIDEEFLGKGAACGESIESDMEDPRPRYKNYFVGGCLCSGKGRADLGLAGLPPLT